MISALGLHRQGWTHQSLKSWTQSMVEDDPRHTRLAALLVSFQSTARSVPYLCAATCQVHMALRRVG